MYIHYREYHTCTYTFTYPSIFNVIPGGGSIDDMGHAIGDVLRHPHESIDVKWRMMVK